MDSYYQPYWLDEDESEHYGVLGMKWGIRRYQNKDGTLTPAGKKRYAGDTPEQIERSERRKAKVIKGAKIAGATALGITVAALGGISLDTAFNSGKGMAAIKKGSSILSYGLTNEGSKLMSSIGKVLNVQNTGLRSSNSRSKIDNLLNVQNTGLRNPDSKSKIDSLLNVQSNSLSTSTPSKRAQELTKQLQAVAAEYERIERSKRGSGRFVG